ncbi:hypothetical protein D3C71_1637920 [compost metagenome]
MPAGAALHVAVDDLGFIKFLPADLLFRSGGHLFEAGPDEFLKSFRKPVHIRDIEYSTEQNEIAPDQEQLGTSFIHSLHHQQLPVRFRKSRHLALPKQEADGFETVPVPGCGFEIEDLGGRHHLRLYFLLQAPVLSAQQRGKTVDQAMILRLRLASEAGPPA